MAKMTVTTSHSIRSPLPMSYFCVLNFHMFRNGFVSKTNLMSTKCVRSYGGVSTTRHTVHSDNGAHHSTTMLKFKSNRNVSFSSAQSSRCLLIVLIAINNRPRCESEWEWNMAMKFNISRPAWPSSFWVSHGMSKKRVATDRESVN